MDIKFQLALLICITSLLGYAFFLCYKSKCSDVICGKYSVHRNTEQEDKNVKPFTVSI